MKKKLPEYESRLIKRITVSEMEYWSSLISILISRSSGDYILKTHPDDGLLEIWGEGRLITSNYNKDVACWYSGLIPFLAGYEQGRFFKEKCEI
jgi:hypothetical protein